MLTLVILYTLYTPIYPKINYVECSRSAFLKMAHLSHFESLHHREPTHLCVTDCYFFANVQDLPFAFPAITIYR